MVCKSPSGVSDVCGHECNQPCCDNACSFPKVISCNCSDGPNGQSSVDGWQSKHAPPYRIFTKNRLKNHSADGQAPREQRWTWVDSSDWIEPISVHDKVSVLSEDVINNPLHVPRVRTTGHVEATCSHSVHGWYSIPLDSYDETDKECYNR